MLVFGDAFYFFYTHRPKTRTAFVLRGIIILPRYAGIPFPASHSHSSSISKVRLYLLNSEFEKSDVRVIKAIVTLF